MREAHCPGGRPGAGTGARPGATRHEDAGGALGPTVAVLVVSLTIAAVGAYELCGFGLHILNPRPRLFNNGFATAGVIVATMAAGAAVGNLVWLLTAPRRRAVRDGVGLFFGGAVADSDTGTAAHRDAGAVADGDAGAVAIPGPGTAAAPAADTAGSVPTAGGPAADTSSDGPGSGSGEGPNGGPADSSDTRSNDVPDRRPGDGPAGAAPAGEEPAAAG